MNFFEFAQECLRAGRKGTFMNYDGNMEKMVWQHG